jgi:M6 family metalloprotease-like protein
VRQFIGILVLFLLAVALAGPGSAATCTQAERDGAVAALAAYQKKMPKDRAAYFKTHKSKKQRAAFVKKQQAKLKRLRAAAACDVPVSPPPPPPPPPPPAETIPPTLQTATASGTTVTLGFDEPLASASDTTVLANGAPVSATSVVSGPTVTLTLSSALDVGSELLVDAKVRDLAGNETVLVSQAVTNTMNAGYAPVLQKQDWADTRYPDEPSASPEFGEWPIDYAYHLRANRLRIIVLFVDQPNRQPMYPPLQVYDTWTSVTKQWERLSSYGRFDLQFDKVDKVYRLSKDSYTPMPDGDSGTLREVILEAAHLADPDVDFSKYDAIWVVGTTGVGNRRLRAWPENAFVLDGKPFQHAEITDYYLVDPPIIEVNGHRVDSTGASHQMLTHELGHHLGLPDLSYKPDPQTPYDFTRVAGWDMMDNPAGVFAGADYMAWNKWRLGWLDPAQIRGLTSPGTVTTTIAPVETAGGVKMVVAQTSPSFLYAVEVRRHKGNDAQSSCDEGVLVYTVDSTKRNGLGPKFVLPAKMGNDTARIITCGAKYEAPFDVGPGEVSTFEDGNVRIDVLSTDGVNYRVRVTRK